MPGVFSPPSPLIEHTGYVRDRRRVDAYAAALAEVVRPGDVVLDLGCGTAILGVLACQAGAGRVYAVDHGPIIELARQVVRANGCADRVTLIPELSTRVALPEPVDVVVADQMSAFGLGAGLLQSFDDASRRHLKPGGVTVPAALSLFLAPASAPPVRAQLDAWLDKPGGVDVSAGRDGVLNIAHLVELQPDALLADAQRVAHWELPCPMRGRTEQRLRFRLRAGTCDGLAGWFEARLSPSVTLTNAPVAAHAIAREQVLLPIPARVAVSEGALVDVQVALDLDHQLLSWRVELRAAPDAPAVMLGQQSSFRGLLLSREALARTLPQHLPRLDDWGAARRSVLDLCDGAHTVAAIEAQVATQFGHLFADGQDAAAFVADLLRRYAR